MHDNEALRLGQHLIGDLSTWRLPRFWHPAQVGLHIVSEVGSDQKITPIGVCEITCFPQQIDAALAQFDCSKTDTLQAIRAQGV